MSLRLAAKMGAVQTVVSMVLSFISIKVTSVYLGPAGLGTLGQLTYFMAMTQAILSSGVGTALVRRTAELGDDPPARERVISTILRALLVAGMTAAVVIALGSNWLARELLHDAQLTAPLLVFAGVLVFGLAATVISSCANGAKDFRTVAFVNIGGGVSAFVMIVALAPRFGVMGGLIATAALPIITWAFAWAFARRSAWWPRNAVAHGFSAPELRTAMTFVPIAIISAVGLPLLQLLIRDDVVAHSGMASVGLLQGVMRMSDMYLGVASGVFAMYFFPRFSEIRDAGELFRETRKGLLIVVPSVAAVGLIIYLFRDVIIRLIFTPEFAPMRDLFGWQVIGNTLKMVGWLLGYVLLAKANAFVFAALELVTIGVWWLVSLYFISKNGALGATQAYAATYALYSIATCIGVFLVLKRMRARPGVVPA
ncbi:MAG: O-antigen translocase [Burkholderiales bacterium]